MDIKTLLIALLAATLTTNLCIVILYWTRRTYPGFGLWVLGSFSRTVGILLFIPREQFPPWLTIILANYLFFAGFLLNNRGVLIFRDRHMSYGWEIAASLSFCALFAYFTYVDPNVAARVGVFGFYIGAVAIWTVVILMTKRPVYFGSSDRLQAVSLGILATFYLVRSGYTLTLESALANHLAALPWAEIDILIGIFTTILLTLGQIMMNAQRIEYDYRMTHERLQQDIIERKRAEASLRESEEKFRRLFKVVPIPLCFVNAQGVLRDINDRFVQVFGYTLDDVPSLNEWWLLAYPDENYRTWVVATWNAAVQKSARDGSDIASVEYRVTGKDGKVRIVEIFGITLSDSFLATFVDITDRKQAEATLNQTKMALEEAQRLAKVGSWDWEIATDTVIWSKELYRIFDRDPNQPPLTYQQHSQLFTAESMVQLEAAVTQALDHGIPYAIDLELIRTDGSTKWIIGSGEPQYDAQRRIVGLRGTCMDITERHRLEDALREKTIRDPLTGLFNRRYLDETLVRELHRCQRNGEPLAVAMLDLDHFKHFNDTYGHETGDAVLRAVGNLVKGFLRASDIACRYGGEELTVILPGSTLDDAQARMDSLRRGIMELRLPYQHEDLPAITVSIGVAVAGEQEADAIALLARADAAMYLAKAGGRNQVR